jgi:hypothetical protein
MTSTFICPNARSYLSELQTEATEDALALITSVYEVMMATGIEMLWHLLDISVANELCFSAEAFKFC